MFSPRFVLNFLCLLALIYEQLRLGDKGNWDILFFPRHCSNIYPEAWGSSGMGYCDWLSLAVISTLLQMRTL